MDGWMDGACPGYIFHWIVCSPVTISPYPRDLKMGFIQLDSFKMGKWWVSSHTQNAQNNMGLLQLVINPILISTNKIFFEDFNIFLPKIFFNLIFKILKKRFKNNIILNILYIPIYLYINIQLCIYIYIAAFGGGYKQPKIFFFLMKTTKIKCILRFLKARI